MLRRNVPIRMMVAVPFLALLFWLPAVAALSPTCIFNDTEGFTYRLPSTVAPISYTLSLEVRNTEVVAIT